MSEWFLTGIVFKTEPTDGQSCKCDTVGFKLANYCTDEEYVVNAEELYNFVQQQNANPTIICQTGEMGIRRVEEYTEPEFINMPRHLSDLTNYGVQYAFLNSLAYNDNDDIITDYAGRPCYILHGGFDLEFK